MDPSFSPNRALRQRMKNLAGQIDPSFRGLKRPLFEETFENVKVFGREGARTRVFVKTGLKVTFAKNGPLLDIVASEARLPRRVA